MEAVLLVVHLIIALGIIVLVLVQPAESGGFLGSGGSMSNMMAPRRKGDVLTRMTGLFATAFFVTSLLLAILASTKPAEPTSILDAAETTSEAPAVIQASEPPAATQEPKAPIAP